MWPATQSSWPEGKAHRYVVLFSDAPCKAQHEHQDPARGRAQRRQRSGPRTLNKNGIIPLIFSMTCPEMQKVVEFSKTKLPAGVEINKLFASLRRSQRDVQQ
jgi:hypothetical protein